MRRKGGILAAVACTTILWGCKVTSQDIEKWKGTQKGPQKLAAVLLDGRYSPGLRAEAAWALAQIGQWDKHDKAIEMIEPSERSEVIEELVPMLVKATREGNAPPSPPTATQVAAKDALFVAFEYAEGEMKRQARDALIAWCIDDFNNRFFAGRYSLEVVLTEVGEDAAIALADVLKPEFLAYDKVTEIIAKIGSKKARENAGDKLVEIARTRKGRVEEALLVALGRMGGKKVRELLLELGSSLKVPARVQRGALMSYLQFGLCNKEDVDMLFKVAEDIDQDYMSRNFAYDAIVCTGDKSQVPRMHKLLHETGVDKDKFRGVGVDEILKLAGPEAIPGIIDEIAAEKDPWEEFEDLRDFVMVRFTQNDKGKPLDDKTREEVLDKIRPLVSSKEPIARAIAVFTLGLIGEKSDVALLRKVAGDGAKLKEWEAKEGEIVVEGGKIQEIEAMDFEKVGDVARWAIDTINKRVESK